MECGFLESLSGGTGSGAAYIEGCRDNRTECHMKIL
jgi:hypothetical protein